MIIDDRCGWAETLHNRLTLHSAATASRGQQGSTRLLKKRVRDLLISSQIIQEYKRGQCANNLAVTTRGLEFQFTIKRNFPMVREEMGLSVQKGVSAHRGHQGGSGRTRVAGNVPRDCITAQVEGQGG